jgi:hypothetical protein
MESEKVVFILGAGASKTYGYPLGDELRQKILIDYVTFLNDLQRHTKYYNFVKQSFDFITHFKASGDKSIDLFLSKFNKYSVPGIKSILHNILMAETQSSFLDQLYFKFKNRREDNLIDDWMWYLYSRLTRQLNMINSYKKLNFNSIRFITFNYDRSLEHFFFERLKNGFNYEIINGSPEEIMSTIQIEHVYGQVCGLPWQSTNNSSLAYGSFNPDQMDLDGYSNNIKLIGQRTSENMEDIYDLIKESSKIFFLGFSYDEINLKTLGIPQILSFNQKIYGTAIGFLKEEIEDIKQKFYYKKPGDPGTQKHNVIIEDCNCTTLLRKYFR